MKKTLTILSGLALLATSSMSYAGQQTGEIGSFYTRSSDNLHYLYLVNGSAKTGSPTCATHPYWMIKDENTTAGKSQTAIILAAKLAGKKVRIEGDNTCSRWFNGESIKYVEIID